jgi:hypothetical protein
LSGVRMSVRDAGWLPHHQLRVIGPLTGVTPSTVRDCLVALHRRDPRHPALCKLDRSARRWVPLGADEFAAAVAGSVAELPGDGGEARSGPAAVLGRVLSGQEPGELPLWVLLHQGYVGIRMSHAVGDARVFNALVPELLGVAAPGPRRPHRTRLPLARASLRHFGRDPRRVGAMLALPRPVLPGTGPHAPTRDSRPDPGSCHVRSPENLLPWLREWRDEHLPGVSVAALLFAATRAAFEECGLAPGHPGLMIQVDARRYLAGTAVVRGNFSAAQYVEPGDPRDPRAVHEALGAAIAAGRPLTTLAVRDLRALRPRRPATPGRVPVDPAPRLTLSHLGRLDHFGALPWACPPAERVLMSAPTTDGPEGVTVSYAEMLGALHVNVAYQRSTFDEAAVRRAADLVCADPVGLLALSGTVANGRRRPGGGAAVVPGGR